MNIQIFVDADHQSGKWYTNENMREGKVRMSVELARKASGRARD